MENNEKNKGNIENCDILGISEILQEDGDMTREALFHNHYAIYLYFTVENEVAIRVVNGDFTQIPIPLKLYESKEISKAMAQNVKNKCTIKIAVNLFVNNNQIYYDQFTMSKAQKNRLKELEKCKKDNELEEMCLYTRKAAKVGGNGATVIEYTINSYNILSNPQYANID